MIQTVSIIRRGKDAKGFDPSKIEAAQKAKQKSLAIKQKKDLPPITGESDPSKVPGKNQPLAEEVSLELMVIAYEGVQTPCLHCITTSPGPRRWRSSWQNWPAERIRISAD